MYQVYVSLYDSIKYFPKKDQYTLGIRLEAMALDILELIFLARARSGAGQTLLLRKVDLKLKTLRLLVRMSHEIGALSQSSYIALEEKLLEIGRIIGGWLRKLNAKPADVPAGLQ